MPDIEEALRACASMKAVWIGFCALAVFVSTTLLYYAFGSRRPKNFPPGPPTLPILGNLHQFPKSHVFLKFHEWAQQYGPIVGLKTGPQNMVVLNDYKHIQDLMDKRGSIYSDRPANHIAKEVIFPDNVHMLFNHYSETWKAMRKISHDILKPSSVDKLIPIQNAEAAQTVVQLLEEPARWYDHVRRYSTSVILASVFGLRGATFDSPRVHRLYNVQDQLTDILVNSPPVDVYPVLKYLPDFLSPWRVKAKRIRRLQHELYFSLVEEGKEVMKRPDAPDCFLSRIILGAASAGLNEAQMVHMAGGNMEAGSDTTAAALLSFCRTMARYPRVLQKCQDEVDALCGTERSPNSGDIDNLPYIKATMFELLRWRPLAPIGIPHALSQDDYYQGYFLPKGTIIIGNAWSVHRTSQFEDGDDFWPERFLGNKYGITDTSNEELIENRRINYGFGAGRRVCAGQWLAETSMMMNMSKFVWVFNITAGPEGISDDVLTEYVDGGIVKPKNCPLNFTARSEKHSEVVRREANAELPFLSTFKAENY